MNILVTGAAGLLGRRLVAELVRQGHTVRAGVRRLTALPEWPAVVQPVACDVGDADQLRAACAGVDAVMHLAFDMGGPAAAQLETALAGTRHLIAALPAGARLILASSFSVYDWDRIGDQLDESSPLLDARSMLAHDGYAGAKLQQEALARRLCAARGVALTVLRPAMIWHDAREPLSCVGPHFAGLDLVIGPRRPLRLTHVDNCAAAFVAALDPRCAGHTYNIEDAYPLSAWAYAGLARRWRLPVPYALAALLLGGAGMLLKPVLGARLPGLLVPQRLHARFHPARAGHAALSAQLGWQPRPLSAVCAGIF